MLIACTTSSAIQPRLESMQRGEISWSEQKLIADSIARFQRATSLPPEKWTQGTALRGGLRDVVGAPRKSVVVIRDGEETVALGTIVGSDGWVLTKASELPKQPVCQLADLKAFPAEVAATNAEFDLALLKLPATSLPVIAWSSDLVDRSVGTIVVAPGIQDDPIAWGMVSVASRNLQGPFPTSIVAAPRSQAQAAPPELTGVRVEEGYWVETVSDDLVSAGIQAGDILCKVDGTQVQSGEDLIRCLNRHFRREPVTVYLLHAGSSRETEVRLIGRRPFRYSFRADDFPTVFEHDVPLAANECGGPIVGLDGKALGLTIASVSGHGCMAIPSDRVQSLVQDLLSNAASRR
jgi:serine protease Do